MLTRRLLFIGLLVTLAAGACKKKEEAGAAGTHVKLALNWVPEPEFGGFYAARESGAYTKRGLDVEIRGGGAGVPVVQMVAGGQADFGIVGADELLTARARGADVLPVFATFQTSPQGIMVHASRGAKNLGDALKSGTLAIEPGAPYAVFLKKKFGFQGVSIVPYDGGVARFLVDPNVSQQCYVTAEPLAAKKQGGDPQVFLVADEGFNPYVGVLIVSRKSWTEHADRVRAFVDASREGWTAYNADPKPTNAVMRKHNASMDEATFADAAAAQKPLTESADTQAHGLGSMTRDRWETLGKQLVELGIIDEAPAVTEYLVSLP
ncbi:MAG TPA: ABC transporter substrate-binding protein [Polyangiaceae bacterium]